MNKKYWVAFANIEKIGSVFINSLYEFCGKNIEEAWNISENALYVIGGLHKGSVNAFLEERKKLNPDELLEACYKKEIKLLTIEDENYPILLKQISNPPVTLFYKGDLSRCNFSKTLAVVGSRNLSISAKDNLINILNDFKNVDLTIVSGGARGADTVAHTCAIQNNLPTIVVMGSGFDIPYPTQNKKMFEKIIAENGVVMTEFYHNSPPIAWHFPMRNRIVSGLSFGTLVAEASLKSGALITANLTLEQNRELMCIPGAINSPNTQGIYKLLKQGAAIVTNSQDILEAMNWKFDIHKAEKSSPMAGLNGIEREIYSLISKDCLTIDEIFNTLTNKNVNFSDLMIILTNLEIKGLIKSTDGSKYTIVT